MARLISPAGSLHEALRRSLHRLILPILDCSPSNSAIASSCETAPGRPAATHSRCAATVASTSASSRRSRRRRLWHCVLTADQRVPACLGGVEALSPSSVTCDHRSKAAGKCLLCGRSSNRDALQGQRLVYATVGRFAMPASVAVAVTAIPWLLSTVVCGLLGTYVVIVLVALLHPDRERRADARAVLDLHMFAALRRKDPDDDQGLTERRHTRH